MKGVSGQLDPPLPRTIGRFALERRLHHQAGVSALYAGRDPDGGGQVAIVVLTHLAHRRVGWRTFERATTLRARLRHPGLAPVVATGFAREGPWFATAVAPASSLAELLDREGPLSPEQAAAILTPVAGALDLAHAHGLVCDAVVPAAVQVQARPGERRYGVLTCVGPPWPVESRPGRLLGDTGGLAPEEIRGEPPSPGSNVYALGALLFRCLTGEPPFPAASRAAALAAHLGAPPPRPTDRLAGLPAALDDLLASALAKDPADRPVSAMDLMAEAALIAGTSPASPARLTPRHAPVADDQTAVPAARAVGPPAPASPILTEPPAVVAAPAARSTGRAMRALALLVPAAMLAGLAGFVALGSVDEDPGNGRMRATPARGAQQPARVLADATLHPPAGGGGGGAPTGVARVVQERGRTLLTVAGADLPPEGRDPVQAYTVWLWNSRRDALRMGAVVPPVGSSGRFLNHGPLPPSAGRYERVVVTLESSLRPRPAGPIVLEADVRLASGR